MKDLYLQLEFDARTDDLEEVRQAIDECADVEIAQSARHILLNPKRKRIYDHHHRLLETIGRLRSQLMLPQSTSWQELDSDDFEHEHDGGFATHDEFEVETDPVAGAKPAAAESNPIPATSSGNSNWISPLKMVMMAMAAFIFGSLLTLFTIMKPSKTEMPDNGHLVRFVNRPTTCQFQIDNPGVEHAYVTLVNVKNNRPACSIMVRAGQTAAADVPSGTYELRYSIGKATDWNGKGFKPQSRSIKPMQLKIHSSRIPKITIPDTNP